MQSDASPLTLLTERLVLTLPGPEAAPRLVAYFETNRSHLAPWEPPFPPGMFTTSFWERRLVQNQDEYRTGKSMRLALLDRREAHGAILGLANFTQFVRGAFMACTLGYSLAAEAEGQGLMYEALTTTLGHVFGRMQMHRVQANYMPVNVRSASLLKRLGFQVEGYARDYIFINGAWRDHILTSLISDEAMLPEYLRAR